MSAALGLLVQRSSGNLEDVTVQTPNFRPLMIESSASQRAVRIPLAFVAQPIQLLKSVTILASTFPSIARNRCFWRVEHLHRRQVPLRRRARHQNQLVIPLSSPTAKTVPALSARAAPLHPGNAFALQAWPQTASCTRKMAAPRI